MPAVADDLTPVLDWLRAWQRLFHGSGRPKEIVYRPRTDQVLADLQRRLARCVGTIEKNDGVGRPLAVSNAAGTLGPLLAHAVARLERDEVYKFVLDSSGVDPTQLAARLQGPLDSLEDLKEILKTLDDGRLSPDLDAVAHATCVLGQEDLSLLASHALRRHRRDELVRLPRAALARACWCGAFAALDAAELARTPAPSLLLGLVESLVDELPADIAHDEEPWDLEGAVQRYADSKHTDPISRVAFDLVHQVIVVTSADDLEGARAAAASYAKNCILNVLYHRTFRADRHVSEATEARADALHATLAQHGWMSNASPLERELRVPQLGAAFTARQAAVRFAARLAGRAAASSLSEADARALADMLSDKSSIELASRDLHARMRPAIRATLDPACIRLRTLGAEDLGTENRSEFARDWARALETWASGATASEWQLPRGRGVPSAAALMASVRRAIVGEPEPRTVGWVIHGLQPRPEPCEFGGVTFTDPEHFDFGQGTYPAVLGRGEPAVLCHLSVEARSASEARAVARTRLEKALDALVYASDGGVDANGGFEPRVVESSIIAEPTTRGWHGRASDERERRSAPLHVDAAAELAPFYGRLLTKEKPSELETRILNALPWYRRARWEKDATRRLLSYWILVEGAFALKRKGGGAFGCIARAAKLHVTWWDLPWMYGFLTMHRQLVRALERDDTLAAQADALLPDWRLPRTAMRDPGCITRLADVLGGTSMFGALPSELDSSARALREADDDVRGSLRLQRWESEIVLDRAYQHRNGIVHRSELVGADDVLLAQQLEGIVERLLARLVGGALRPQPIETLTDLLAWWDDPFV